MLFSCGQATKTSNNALPAQDAKTVETQYKALYKETLILRDKAIELKGLWTTVAPLLVDSEEAAKQNKYDDAIKFAQEAKQHIELSIQQAELEKQNWKASKDNIFN
jgi:hypothetical protein